MDFGGSGWLGMAAEAYDGALRAGGGERALRIVAGVLARLHGHDGPQHRLDPWLDALDRELAGWGRTLPAPAEPYVFAAARAVLSRRPAHPGLPLWYARALARLRGPEDADVRLVAAAFAFEFAVRGGLFREAHLVVVAVRPLVERAESGVRLEWLAAEARLAWLSGDAPRAWSLVDAAVSLGGGHALDVESMSAALGACDAAAATRAYENARQSLSGRPHDHAHLDFLAAGRALLLGDVDEARGRIGACLRRSLAASPYFAALWLLGRSQVKACAGDVRGARRDAAQVAGSAVEHGWRFLQFSALATRAWLDVTAARPADALRHLADALAIAQAHGYRHCAPWWRPAMWRDLGAFAARVPHDHATMAPLLAERGA